MSGKATEENLSFALKTLIKFKENWDEEVIEAAINFEVDAEDEGKGQTLKTEKRQQKLVFPMWLFSDGIQANEWAREVKMAFYNHLSEYLMLAASDHFLLVAYLILHKMGLGNVNISAAIDEIYQGRAQDEKRALRLPIKGQHSAWTTINLLFSVRRALDSLPKARRTLENVASKLKEYHPDIAPKNGEALRKLMERLEINWRDLKKEAKTGA